jgi:hypothetical protein
MSIDSRGFKQCPQDKRKATVYNIEWMRRFLATIETHPDLFRDVIGPLWAARLEAEEEIGGTALYGLQSAFERGREHDGVSRPASPRGEHRPSLPAVLERREEVTHYRRSLAPREEKRTMPATNNPMPSVMPNTNTKPSHPHRALLSHKASTDTV